MANIHGRLNGNRGQDWANLLLGGWLFFSPWVLGFAGAAGGDGTATSSVAASNAWALGLVIAALSLAALVRNQPWEEWLNSLAGLWMILSPWVLGYNQNATAVWNSLIVGALVLIVAVWDLNTMPTASQGRK